MIMASMSLMLFAEQKEIEIIKNTKLIIEFNDYGTKSEGQTGKLYVDDKEILGKDGEVTEIAGIKLLFYPKNQPHSWMIKGWNYADATQIKFSYSK